MRKWLLLFLAVALVFALSKISTRQNRRQFPLLQRIDNAVTVVVVVLLGTYLFAFIHWLLTR
jgi:hypothetical protein